MEGLTAAAVASSTFLVAYAAWWLVRHERAVRRFRARVEPPAPRVRR